MAAEKVMDWLLGDAVINPVTRPLSHGMKLWEFVLNKGTLISLWHNLPSHLWMGRNGGPCGVCHLGSGLAPLLCGSHHNACTQLLVHVPPPIEFDPFVEEEELDRGQGIAPVQVSIDDYNEVCQLYEAARLKLVVPRLSDEHRVDMAPLTGRGQGMERGRRAGHGSGRRP
ncbi:hypothetical protein JCGZ_19120 [Jatropha curcas]|uniref:Uncharacterized protein n=1 Tax=Jatropha curcas TaxID=180498 RepID=A0A067K4I3_JATCU|nr:hypothetical protein JCGZ_19120 [Jatropha curcas]